MPRKSTKTKKPAKSAAKVNPSTNPSGRHPSEPAMTDKDEGMLVEIWRNTNGRAAVKIGECDHDVPMTTADLGAIGISVQIGDVVYQSFAFPDPQVMGAAIYIIKE